MKQFYLLALMVFLSFSVSAQVVFVDADASGNNDGTSWTDAFTTMEAAITAAADGDALWVADGLYQPASDPFFVDKNISIIGGFNGTETSAEEADPDLNVTVFSGDIALDDNPDDLQANRGDNVIIMRVDSLLDLVTINNIAFTGGQIGIRQDGDPFDDFNGSCVRSYSTLNMANCFFSGNVGHFGPGVSVIGAPNSVFDNITAVGNLATGRGVIAAFSSPNVLIKNSEFDANTVDHGTVYYEVSNGLIDSCTFTNNVALNRGAAVGFLLSPGASMSNTRLQDNIVDGEGVGGALSLIGLTDAGTPSDINEHVFDNCEFIGNSGPLGGGGLFLSINALFRDCIFRANVAGAIGGAYTAVNFDDDPATNPDKKLIRMENCLMEENQVTGGNLFGPNIYTELAYSYEFDSCTMRDNGSTASTEIGSVLFLFGDANGGLTEQTATFTNCEIVNNQAGGGMRGWGGVAYAQTAAGVIDLNFDNCDILNNGSRQLGGAIMTQNSVRTTVTNCDVAFNTTNGSGGFLWDFESQTDFQSGPGAEKGLITLRNNIFRQNFAANQGGVVDANGTDIVAVNNLFFGNDLTGGADAGSGGAIIANTDTSDQAVLLVNNTFYENSAGNFASDVSTFSDGGNDVGQLTLTLQNNAFASNAGLANVGFEDVAESNTDEITIISNGGNFFAVEPTDFDAAMDDIVDEDQDLEELFVSVDDFEEADLNINQDLENNPLIDGGVTGDDVPATDIVGTERVGTPDIGAYEVPAEPLPTVADIIAASESHTTLESLLNTAGLTATLGEPGPFTVFAPTDAAFAVLTMEQLDLLNEGDNLRNTLLTHVIGDAVESSMVTEGLIAPSLAPMTNLEFSLSPSVTVTTSQGEVANIIEFDLAGSNGFVHVIDAVLIPAIVNVRNIEESGLDVQFFPNPVQNQMTVNISDVSIETVKVAVLNLNGQRLSNWSFGNGNNLVDFTQLPAGTYTLEIDIDGALYSKQIVKQ
ncbi:MAG: fasciclin domain-containing protein [Bacteroidota bacterium]